LEMTSFPISLLIYKQMNELIAINVSLENAQAPKKRPTT